MCHCFWMCQSFGYTRVLNIPDFWLCQGYTGIRICLNNSWICLIMFGYVWIFLNMPEYLWMCLSLPEWLLFYISTFSHLFYNPFSTWRCGYLFEHLQETSGYSLKEHVALFLKRLWKFDFAYSSWKYFIVSFFLDKIFLQVRFKLAFTFCGQGFCGSGLTLDIPFYFFVFPSSKVVKKSCI